MKKTIFLAFCCWLCFVCTNAQATIVEYSITDSSAGHFEYTYSVTNDNLGIPIEEFTIWFDTDLYDNFTITTQEPLASQWDEIILQDTGFGLPIGYDALALGSGIEPTETISGFSVSFDWLGAGLPASQFFEIIDPLTFETIDFGFTVPEPSTLLMFILCGLIFRLKLKHAR